MAKAKLIYEQTAAGPMLLAVHSSATSMGDNTLSDVNVKATVDDHGRVTIARGEVTTTSFASSTSGSASYSTTDTYVTAEGANLFHTNCTVTEGGSGAEDGWTFQSTTTRFFAIDIEGIDLSGGAVAITTTHASAVLEPPLSVEGNLALLEVTVTATGDSSLVDLDSSAFATSSFSDTTVSFVAVADTPFL